MGLPDGQQTIVTFPLSDQEMRAYRESPRTIFGREEPVTKAETPLDLYDWMLNCYRDTPKERLLELLAQTGVQPADMASLPQSKLTGLLSERWTESILRNTGKGVKKVLSG